jgi:hypothetical protein
MFVMSKTVARCGLLAGSLALAACATGAPASQPFQVGQKVIEGQASAAAQRASMRLVILDDTARPAGAYHVAYIQNSEWNKATFTLDKVDGSVTPKTLTIDATVTPTTLIRSAVANFTSLTPGLGYRVTVQLIKTDATGTDKVIATGTNDGTAAAGFELVPGANSLDINIALTEDEGKVEIAFPAAGSAGSTSGATVNVESNSAYNVARVAGATDMTTPGTFSTGAANWLATTLSNATGMEMSTTGDMYVAASNRIVKLPGAGTNPVVIAGTGTAGYNGPGAVSYTNDDVATNNQINDARGVALKGSFLYFCDRANNLVRQVNLTTGVISNVAGRGATAPDATPRLGSDVVLNAPSGVVVDLAGNLFVTESGANRLLKITPDGMVTAFVTTGLAAPDAIEVDRTGNRLWVGCGTAVYAITNIDTTPSSPVTIGAIPAPAGANTSALTSIGGLAYDYNQTLYVQTNGKSNYQQASLDGFPTTPSTYYSTNTGDYNNFVYRVALNTTGTLRTGFGMERIAGKTNTYAGARSFYTSSWPALSYGNNASVSATTTPVANAVDQAMVGAVTDGLALDMRNGGSTTTLGGFLFKMNANVTTGAAQVLKLSPNAP